MMSPGSRVIVLVWNEFDGDGGGHRRSGVMGAVLLHHDWGVDMRPLAQRKIAGIAGLVERD